jgi:perosamine synthetase
VSILALHGGEPTVRHGSVEPWPKVTPDLERRMLSALWGRQLAYSEDSICRRFEEDFASYHAMPFALAANSGTSALLLAYFALGIGLMSGGSERDEVIVPAWGFFATASPLIMLRAVPVFCDAEEDTQNLNPRLLEALVTPRTRAIAVTHVAGHPVDMDAILTVARRHGLSVVEDCSHAHGSRLDGRLVGTMGDVAAFSLQTGKMVCAGEGGMVLTGHRDLFARAAALGNFRRLQGTAESLPEILDETGLGLKLRLGPLGAALASYHLEHLDELIAARRERLDLLTERLSEIPGVAPPVTRKGATRGAYYEYTLRAKAAADGHLPVALLRHALRAEGVLLPPSNTKDVTRLPLLRMAFPIALAVLSPSSDAAAWAPMGPPFPVASRLEKSVIRLPTFTHEPQALVESYAMAVEKVFRNLDQLTSGAALEVSL